MPIAMCYEYHYETYCHGNQKQIQLKFLNMNPNMKVKYTSRKWYQFLFIVGKYYSHTYHFSIYDTFQLRWVQCDDDGGIRYIGVHMHVHTFQKYPLKKL